MKYYLIYWLDFTHYMEEFNSTREVEKRLSEISQEKKEGSSEPILIQGKIIKYDPVVQTPTFKITVDEKS